MYISASLFNGQNVSFYTATREKIGCCDMANFVGE
jgi:hypothetical protein